MGTHSTYWRADEKERLLMIDECLCLLPHCQEAEVPGLAILIVDRQVECKSRDAANSRVSLGRRGNPRGSVPLGDSGSEVLRRLTSRSSAVMAN